MKKIALTLSGLLLTSSVAFAGSYTDKATIVSVEKVYRTHTIREPYQDCYIKEFYQGESDGSMTNEIMGGILGGLIGNQFGDGDGKKAATVAGTLLGASLAHDDELAKAKTGKVVSREVCETKYRNETERRLSHYRVEYEYDGRTFTYTTKNKPFSDTLQVRVQVTPK